MNKHFCTCQSRDCPYNPFNHDEGCSPCIQKNLRRREIPSCFFNLLENAEQGKGYSFKDFAELVLAGKEN